jgi:hypothetical protein
MEWRGNPFGWKKNQDPSSAPERDWQDGASGLLLVAAVHETGLLAHLETAIDPCLTQTSHPHLPPSLRSQRSLLLTLLLLNAVGLRRTRDLRGYTDEALGFLTGRRRAYSYWHTERFLTHLANGGGAEDLTNARGRVDCNAMAIGRRAGSGLLRLHRWASQASVCRQADSSRTDWLLRQNSGVSTVGLPPILVRYQDSEGEAPSVRVIVDREGWNPSPKSDVCATGTGPAWATGA